MEIKKATFWAYHVYYFKKDRNAAETHTQKKISAVYGEGSVTDWMSTYFVKFLDGDFSLDNAPWSDRQIDVNSDPI